MKTTLQTICAAMNWSGGTIHQAKKIFNGGTDKLRDYICSDLILNIKNISDLETLRYFTDLRLEILGLDIKNFNN